ncbi:hypothetical protein GF325_17280 [Candidatus Bathyarchaeota archaeon]|nr:hypothetical protein [Candidatus Bathyarchaeota archaeon]
MTLSTVETCIPIPPCHQGEDPVALIQEWMHRASELGYRGIVVDLTGWPMDGRFQACLQEARAENITMDVFTRATIAVPDRSQVKRAFRNIRKKLGVDFIALTSPDESTLNYAAKDTRIDIIHLGHLREFEAFTDGVASLAGQSGIFVELPFYMLLHVPSRHRSRILRGFNKVMHACASNHARVLVSSWPRSPVDLKNAWQKQVTLSELLDASRQACRTIVVDNPRELVEP